jgi:hypothetical protein
MSSGISHLATSLLLKFNLRSSNCLNTFPFNTDEVLGVNRQVSNARLKTRHVGPPILKCPNRLLVHVVF